MGFFVPVVCYGTLLSIDFPPHLVVYLVVSYKSVVVTVALTALGIRNAKSKAKQYKLSAGVFNHARAHLVKVQEKYMEEMGF